MSYRGTFVSWIYLYFVEKGAGSVLWQDEMNARGGSEVSIDIGGAGAHFQQDQLQLIEDQVLSIYTYWGSGIVWPVFV